MFETVKVISGEDDEHRLKNQDAEELPIQFLDVYKNKFKGAEQADIPPRMESRLAVWRDMFQIFTWSDSPTAGASSDD